MSNLLSVQQIEVYKLLFSRGSFDFVVQAPNGERNLKQQKALQLLTKSDVSELMFGGAAGGAKSWTGCVWLLFMCLLFPGTKWFIGRETLKDIRDSTLITFGKVARRYGLSIMIDWKYNGQDNFIHFPNGSRIDMLDLSYMPSDPMYERMGSKEYTGGFLEECGQIHFNAFDVLKSRIGRHLNDKYGIKARLFLTCNPKKNWIYTYFVRPKQDGTLSTGKEFIKSLATDNPYRESDYLERLNSITDKVQRARLLDGSFEYDDDPSALIDYDSILAIFSNINVKVGGNKYITCDVARYGRDKSIIIVWVGFRIIEIKELAKSATTEVYEAIKTFQRTYGIPNKSVIVDEDGVGGGVIDASGKTRDTRYNGFINNSAPIKQAMEDKEQYVNLKSQCSFKLAKRIVDRGISVAAKITTAQKDCIIEELEQIKQKNMDGDGKRAVMGKDDVKQILGRSPDYSDAIMFREWFELSAPIAIKVHRNFK